MDRNQRLRVKGRALAVLAWILALTLPACPANWQEQILYSFQGGSDGHEPAGGVIFDKAGNLYGATVGGGTGIGTVFELSPNGGTWNEIALYSFQGKPFNDGDLPSSGLVSDPAGNLYGVTAYGGTGNCVLLGGDVGCGIVYQMTPTKIQGGSWTETVIYSFQGGTDGYLPQGDLIFDGKGNLYGATEFGGGYGSTCNPFYQYCGTIFELSPPKEKGGAWTEKVLYSFKGGNDGANPNGGLVFDKQGVLYGTTFFGANQQGCNQSGGVGCGIVFKLNPPVKRGGAWKEKVLYRFNGNPGDGGNPAAGLIFDKTGNLYSTTLSGGRPTGDGTVFRLTPPGKGHATTWSETLLHSFNFNNGNGVIPMAGLTFDSRGDLYGTTSGGGTSGGGILFRLGHAKADRWIFSVLHNFNSDPDGFYPTANLIFDEAGFLYGTTQYGGTGQGGQNCGASGCGTVFQTKP